MKLLSAVLLDRKNWSNSSFGYYKIYGAKKDLEKNKKIGKKFNLIGKKLLKIIK